MTRNTSRKKAVGERIHDRMAAARHVPEDAGWTYGAVMHLAMVDVADDVIERELFAVAETVARTGESPEDLFGDSRDWAVAKVEGWKDDGAEVFTEPDRWGVIDLLFFTPFFGTWFAVLFVLLDILHGNWAVDFTVGRVLMPLILSFVTMAAVFVFHHLTVRRGFLWAVLGAVLTGGVLVVGAAWFFTGIPWAKHRGPCWWDLAVLGGCAALTAAAFPLWVRQKSMREETRAGAQAEATRDGAGIHAEGEPGGSRRAVDPLAEDVEGLPAERKSSADRPVEDRDQQDLDWAEAARRTMRARGDLTEKSIRRALGEAKAHAVDAGATLREEFGAPLDYARALPGDAALPVRREVWARVLAFLLVVLALVLTLTTSGGAPSAVLAGVLWVLAAVVVLVLAVRRLRRRTAERRRDRDPLG